MSVEAKKSNIPNSNPSKKNLAPNSKNSANIPSTDPSLASMIQNSL